MLAISWGRRDEVLGSGVRHTLDGAISAALNYHAHGTELVYTLDDTAMKLAKRTSATQEFADAVAGPSYLAKARSQLGIDAQARWSIAQRGRWTYRDG